MFKIFIVALLLLSGCSTQKPSQNSSNPSPDIVVSPPVLPPPSEELKTDFMSIASQIDMYYNRNELTKARGETTFAESIFSAVSEGMNEKVIPFDSYIRSVFNIVGDNPVSLNELLCTYDNSMAQRLVRTSFSSNGLGLVNRFITEVNSMTTANRRKAYTRLMMCLAYSESLGDADTSRSDTIASREGVSRNSGVKFYFDSLQTNPDSQINIGLYQFSPISGGNINPCIVDLGSNGRDRKSLVNLIGEESQLWNARCGVHKILTLFYVSKNTSNTSRKAGPSCVALHNRNAYNHFGPLQREGGAGGGFTKLYNCYFGSSSL